MANADNGVFVVDRDCPPAVTVDTAADCVPHFAAAELKSYLADILGRELPESGTPTISIVVATAAGRDAEEHTIEISPDRIVISGGARAGALYGVYEFLRRFCGCRFSNPAPDGELIPRLDKIRIPCRTVVRKPLTAVRGMQINRKHEPEVLRRHVDWMMKIGLNTVMTIPMADDDPRLEMVDTDPVTSEARTSGGGHAYTDGWFREHIMPAIRERGMKICMANHNFRRWVPPHRYFDEHPEWYALHGGKRNPWIGQMCLCTTNADMLAAMTANIKQYLRENPEVGIVGVCPEDGYGCCQCEACRALDDDPRAAFRTDRPNYRTPQGENRSLIRRYALLANAVARALRKEFPDVLVYYTAYIDLQWPPRDVRLEDNVAVMLALYWRCAAHLIAADGCAMNRFFYDLLRQWQRAHRGPLFIHDYYYGMDSQRALPYPMGAVICANWPVYRQIGVAGVKTNTKSTHLAALGLNYTAFARCGWEKQVDYDALRNEFVTGMFGAAAPALLPVYAAFDRAVEKIARGAATDSPFIKPVPPARGCLLPNGRNIGYFIDEIGAGFLTAAARRAEDMAVNDRERRQVARFRDAVEYWRLSREFCERIMKAEAAEKAGGGAARRWYGLAHASILDLIEHSERKGLDGWGVTPGVFAWQADELARKAT